MKKLRYVYTLLFIFLMASSGFSQEFQLSGKIVSESGEDIPYANIALLEPTDSSLIDGTLSDISGNFTLKLPAQEYLLRISFLSYREYWSKISLNKELNLGTLVLEEDAEILEEVEVRAERSQLTMKLDKRIFNVGKDLTSRGGNASDILDNIPSVNVDVEGNVSLRGSGNVRILIDGKESAMVTDGGAFLRQFPANMIKQIEVITNPSAKYQADGETGIINIILQKNTEKKINGSLEASLGDPAHHGLSYILNWRGESLGFQSSYGLLYRKFRGGGSIMQDFFDANEEDYNSDRSHQRGGLNHNFRLGLDWYLNPKNTISLVGLFNPRTADNEANIDYEYFSVNSENSYHVTREDTEREEAQNIEFSLTHNKELGEKDHKWTNLVSFNRRDDVEKNTITERTDLNESTIDQFVRNREDAQTLILQSDYSRPFSEDHRIEMGIRGSFRRIENEFLVEESQDNSPPITLKNFDNLFQYDEDIYAAYFMTGNKILKWSYQAGLRVEHSEIGTELVKTAESNPRSYTNLFPSGLLNYELDSLNAFQISYSRRITRPRLWSLFPFFTFSDNRNLASGNPNLDPELTNSFELAWLKNHTTGNIMAAVIYRKSKDVIQRISTKSEDGIIRSFPINIAERDAYGLELSSGFRPKEWVKMTLSTYLAYESLTGSYESVSFNTDYFNSSSRVGAQIDIGKSVDFQVNYNYDTPFNIPQGRREAMSFLNLALSKKFWDNRASLTLSVKDLFNSRIRRSKINTENFIQESDFQWRQRQLIATFNYRFGKNSSGSKDRKRP